MSEGIDGVRAILSVASTNERRALVAFCGLQGLRVSEARSIRCEDVDHSRMMLRVRGKGDKTRMIPLSVEAWEFISPAFIDARIADSTLVTMNDRSARVAITTLAARAGMSRPVASHDLRATFATDLFNRCLNIRIVQEFMGHSSSHTTETYTAVVKNQMRAALETL